MTVKKSLVRSMVVDALKNQSFDAKDYVIKQLQSMGADEDTVDYAKTYFQYMSDAYYPD